MQKIEIPLSNTYRTCNFRDVHVQVFVQRVFAHVILLLSPYIKIHISSPCLDMHWTIENPRREIPRQTPLAQIDIRRWEAAALAERTITKAPLD